MGKPSQDMLLNTQTQIEDPGLRARLLAALYIAQEQAGWLNPEAIQRVAKRLKLSVGQVFSTASFYSMFKLHPHGKYTIQICEGLSCYLTGGAESILDHLSRRLEIKAGETTVDGKFTIEVVQCLAACDLAPAMKINDELFGNLNMKRLDDILEDLSAREWEKR